ncbi:hypothetical protein Y032_0635g916 [Ancylostoma ceylanicum]|uniref:Uncharacterized protein n=1 Tax=Ancylostoma ceylanicum TaxID=53326 RepID=A0A016WJF3_9BILA|nr:hypothetical protein Y032_0635g916 [Ancylostoma ceylanicum]
MTSSNNRLITTLQPIPDQSLELARSSAKRAISLETAFSTSNDEWYFTAGSSRAAPLKNEEVEDNSETCDA